MKKVLSIIAMATLLGGCATGPSYDDLVAQANNEISVAKNMDYLWRDTEKFLKEAEKAKQAGEMAEAKKLAQKALTEAKMAQQQAKDNANAAPYYK